MPFPFGGYDRDKTRRGGHPTIIRDPFETYGVGMVTHLSRLVDQGLLHLADDKCNIVSSTEHEVAYDLTLHSHNHKLHMHVCVRVCLCLGCRASAGVLCVCVWCVWCACVVVWCDSMSCLFLPLHRFSCGLPPTKPQPLSHVVAVCCVHVLAVVVGANGSQDAAVGGTTLIVSDAALPNATCRFACPAATYGTTTSLVNIPHRHRLPIP
eukprot:CAMPEP_0175835574 /NCGR_PEP_ID=MMETSP0107_2-20121207/16667_1 /TAXON_ID=195067 ORGANISM="Goniomonas pacifica, Strain CCMP1869" /NCGR_SAMPLE_ID=MMETSP0107_2 /ASSEMBLY_ACC=CAM_ASM_000203 /LENGTH=208 /DNA_ID=CAMNT_0017148881 /DNA_START=635 /DNA_END=1258 /DNA_ORIENTATION=+